jgi:hypothetical protein
MLAKTKSGVNRSGGASAFAHSQDLAFLPYAAQKFRLASKLADTMGEPANQLFNLYM